MSQARTSSPRRPRWGVLLALVGACSPYQGHATADASNADAVRPAVDAGASDADVPSAPSKCPEGEVRCGGACVRLAVSADHCGACDRRCPADRLCVAGACAEPTAQRSCATSAPGCGIAVVRGATITLGDTTGGTATPRQPGQTVSSFALDRYEVTVARFRRFWSAGGPDVPGLVIAYPGTPELDVNGPSLEPSRGTGCTWTPTPGGHEDLPINCLTWATAQAFCVWDGGRLPTEAEWELAARGEEGRAWPWGNIDDLGRACGRVTAPRDGPCRVDDPAFAEGATPLGLFQMAGNVWEYCADWYEVFQASGDACWNMTPRLDPVCHESPRDHRVVRGGGWLDRAPGGYRGTSRGYFTPWLPDPGIGFRCARSR